MLGLPAIGESNAVHVVLAEGLVQCRVQGQRCCFSAEGHNGAECKIVGLGSVHRRVDAAIEANGVSALKLAQRDGVFHADRRDAEVLIERLVRCRLDGREPIVGDRVVGRRIDRATEPL